VKYKAVVFDLYGTLVDNYIQQEYDSVLAEMSSVLKAPEDEFRRLWRETFPERINGSHSSHEESIEIICRKLSVQVTGEQIKHATLLRLEYSVRTLKPRAGSIEVLQHLQSNGYKTALVTDCSPETPLVWPDTAFAAHFDVTVFSCSAGVKKPDPRIYRMATERLGVEARDCVYVGDGGSYELTGALKVGMYPVLIRVPDEPADAHFIDRQDWDGTVISSLPEALGLL
jgi:putative hydrolase of the HAD superfamily